MVWRSHGVSRILGDCFSSKDIWFRLNPSPLIMLAPALLPPLQPPDNLLVNAMNGRRQVLVGELRSTVADDDIAIGERLGSGSVIAALLADVCFRGNADISTILSNSFTTIHVLPESFRLSNDFQMKGVLLGYGPCDLFSFSSCRERPLRERGR